MKYIEAKIEVLEISKNVDVIKTSGELGFYDGGLNVGNASANDIKDLFAR